jgi:8-oxo-dGTP diphosphatase
MPNEKVVAYITHGRRVLVFRHVDFPEAGIQVPAGTVEPGEPLDRAVLREAYEETGLEGLQIVAYLGARDRDLAARGLSGVQRRHFYHLALGGPTEAVPERWLHAEEHPSDGGPAPIVFELYWAPLPDGIPELAGEQGALLDQVIAR